MPAASSRHPYHLYASAYGVPFELRSDGESLLSAAASYLPFGAEITAEGVASAEIFTLLDETQSAPIRLRRGNRTIFLDPCREPVLDRLRSLLILHVAEHSPGMIFIHAGVVGWHNRAIVLPGRSFAGKTTLTAELVRAGALYYSDEYAVVDPLGFVHPYAQDLQMRTPGSALQHKTPVAALEGSSGTKPLRVSLVAFAHFRAGAEWRPEPVSAGRAVLEMLPHTISTRRVPATVLKTLTRMMEGARTDRSARGEAPLTARAILDSLAST